MSKIESATATSTGQEMSTEKGPRVWMDMDQKELDDAYDQELEGRAGFPDPLERSNRAIFNFNGYFDRFVLDPLADCLP